MDQSLLAGNKLPAEDAACELPEVRFLAIGDFGYDIPSLPEGMNPSDTDLPGPMLAHAMSTYAAATGKPDFILGLGDNFYPGGVNSVEDSRFNTTWRNVYLPHESLQCTWHMVLGNHDYHENPDAQIQYTDSLLNVGSFWHMPARNYQFTAGQVEFFALDTCCVQGNVRRLVPGIESKLFKHIEDLDRALAASRARFKIVFGHHPMYTKGRYHGILGRCLRGPSYTYRPSRFDESITAPGYNLEAVLSRHGVCAYITGHEHKFQHHFAANIHNLVCGASCDNVFYGGEVKKSSLCPCVLQMLVQFVKLM